MEKSVLLKIHRQFSKDESVAALLFEIKQLKFKLGELTSENEELKFHIDKYKKITEELKSKKDILSDEIHELKKIKPLSIEVKKDILVQEYKNQRDLINKQRIEYKKKFIDMSSKFYSANAKILKLEEQLKNDI